jgi:hypothetical protein
MVMSHKDQLAEQTEILEELVRRSRIPVHLAALGSAYLLRKRFHESAQMFEEASIDTKGKDHPDLRYTYLYCQVYLSIAQDSPSFYELMKEAASIPCKTSLRRWLPLPILPRGETN